MTPIRPLDHRLPQGLHNKVAVGRKEILDGLKVKRLCFNTHGRETLLGVCPGYNELSISRKISDMSWLNVRDMTNCAGSETH